MSTSAEPRPADTLPGLMRSLGARAHQLRAAIDWHRSGEYLDAVVEPRPPARDVRQSGATARRVSSARPRYEAEMLGQIADDERALQTRRERAKLLDRAR